MTKNIRAYKYFFLIAAAFILVSGTIPVKNIYTISKGYTVSIHGTSNLHDWDETVEAVNGESTVNWNGDGSFDLEAIHLKMSVHSIKSDMGVIMNNNTYKALKADANPEIIFSLRDAIRSIQVQPNENAFPAKGDLTIAGVTRPVQLQVKVLAQGREKLLFEGLQTIKMTDYGVDPPTALFGTLKTGNEISIRFKTSFTIKNN